MLPLLKASNKWQDEQYIAIPQRGARKVKLLFEEEEEEEEKK